MVAAGPVRWGTIPEFAAAVGTVGTLALTYVLLRRAEQQREQEQAGSVAVWVELKRRDGAGSSTIRSAALLPRLFVRNASSSPVYSTEVDIRCGGVTTTTIDIGVAAPGQTVEKVLYDEDLGRGDEPKKTYGFDPDAYKALAVTAGVRFTDSAGRRWERDPAGHLRRDQPDQLRPVLRRMLRRR